MKFSQLICCITILLYNMTVVQCFANDIYVPDKKLSNGNIEVHVDRYKYYINKMTDQDAELKQLRPLNISFKTIIEIQKEEIRLFKLNISSYQKEIVYHDRINKQQEEYIAWGNLRLNVYRKEVQRLESRPEGFWRRTKDHLFWPMFGLALGSLSQQFNE